MIKITKVIIVKKIKIMIKYNKLNKKKQINNLKISYLIIKLINLYKFKIMKRIKMIFKI